MKSPAQDLSPELRALLVCPRCRGDLQDPIGGLACRVWRPPGSGPAPTTSADLVDHLDSRFSTQNLETSKVWSPNTRLCFYTKLCFYTQAPDFPGICAFMFGTCLGAGGASGTGGARCLPDSEEGAGVAGGEWRE